MTATYLEKEFGMPFVSTTPMGVVDTAALFVRWENCTGRKRRHPSSSSASLLSPEAQVENRGGTVSSSNEKRWEEEWLEKYIDQQTRFVSQAAWFLAQSIVKI
jgi:light-independent protochlorophyllide reductase subunit B